MAISDIGPQIGRQPAWLDEAGCSWLTTTLSREFHTYIGDSQDTFPAWNHTLLLAMDVYEHAYFLDFQTARMKYIEAFMQVIDWNAVNARIPKIRTTSSNQILFEEGAG